MAQEIRRGDVYWVNLDPTIGSEIKKVRPAIIVSNNIQNRISNRLVIVPVTSNIRDIYPFEARIVIFNKESKALADQIRTIDKIRLSNYIDSLKSTELKDIEKAIKITLGLD